MKHSVMLIMLLLCSASVWAVPDTISREEYEIDQASLQLQIDQLRNIITQLNHAELKGHAGDKKSKSKQFAEHKTVHQ